MPLLAALGAPVALGWARAKERSAAQFVRSWQQVGGTFGRRAAPAVKAARDAGLRAADAKCAWLRAQREAQETARGGAPAGARGGGELVAVVEAAALGAAARPVGAALSLRGPRAWRCACSCAPGRPAPECACPCAPCRHARESACARAAGRGGAIGRGRRRGGRRLRVRSRVHLQVRMLRPRRGGDRSSLFMEAEGGVCSWRPRGERVWPSGRVGVSGSATDPWRGRRRLGSSL
jgi:hypothetical protein